MPPNPPPVVPIGRIGSPSTHVASSTVRKPKSGGLFGISWMPQLGVGRAASEISHGLTGLVTLGLNALPDRVTGHRPKNNYGALGKGLASSALGTLATGEMLANLATFQPGKHHPIEDLGQRLLGQQYRPKNWYQKAKQRGVIPATIEDLGNVAIAGSIAKAPVSIGLKAAEAGGDVERAARLASWADKLDAVAHPYRSVARAGSDLALSAADQVRPGVGIAREGAPLTASEIIARDAEEVPAADAAAKAVDAAGPVSQAVKSPPLRDAGATALTLEEATNPAVLAAHKAQVAAAVESARAAIPPPEATGIGAAIAARRARPWAVAVTDHLPDPVNRALAAVAPMVRRHRLAAVEKDLGRMTRVAQKLAVSSDAVVTSRQAAETILKAVPELDRFQVSRMVGEEIGARLDGTDWFETAIRDGANPEAADALRLQARRNFKGIPEDVWNKLGPEGAATLNQTLDTAVQSWRTERQAALQTLLSTRKGAAGVEDAVLQTDAPLVTGADLRRLNRARKMLYRAGELRKRAPDERLAMAGKLEKLDGVIERRTNTVETLRKNLNEVSERTSELHYPLPPGVTHMNETVSKILTDYQANGGTTFDVALGSPATETTGYAVGGMVSHGGNDLFDIDKATFDANAPAILKDVILSNQDVWAHPDARLGLWDYTDANGLPRVAGDVSTTVQNRELAILMGEARGQKALYDLNQGGDLVLSGNPDMQALARLYHNEALRNPGSSPLLRVWRETVAAAEAAGATPQMADDAMQVWMNLDYGMHASKGTPLGTFFKNATVDTGSKLPNAPYLEQTVLNIGTEEAVQRAFDTLSSEDVSKALAWYYDSHDYVESLYRGKPMTMLNGTTRDSADVFYDLLAVTSVMANPKQNLGRAFMSLANYSDYMAAQPRALTAAKALFKKIESIPPGRSPTPPGFATTAEVASRFAEIPELRALTESTSMIASPKQNIIDILTGKLDLSKATTQDISGLPEAWVGKGKGLGLANLPRENVIRHLEAAGVDSTEYRKIADNIAESERNAAKVKALQSTGVTPSEAKRLAGLSPKANIQRDLQKFRAAEQALADANPEIRKALDMAAMEYHGSKALAKLRSFRDNLANPADSLAVTLDTVMANLYGLDSTDWAGGNTYGQYAWSVREAAANLSEKLGRPVKPHEVQALLWIYAKREVGRQDWGRLLTWHDNALDSIDQAVAQGQRLGDPLGDWWNEELAWSQEAQLVRQQRRDLLAKARTYNGQLSPQDAADLEQLKGTDVASPVQSTIVTAMDRENLAALPEDSAYSVEMRHEIADDSKVLAKKQASHDIWRYQVLPQIQRAVDAGDATTAKRLLTDYVVSWKSKLLGPSGGSMAEEGARSAVEPGTSQYQAVERLAANKSKHVPAPSTPESRYVSSMAARFNRAHGLPEPQSVNTLVKVNPARTAEVAAAYDALPATVADMTPEQIAEATRSYDALKSAVHDQYVFMTQAPDGPKIKVEFGGDYGVVNGEYPPAEVMHQMMVDDVKQGHLQVRSTELNGDQPNEFMAGKDPATGITWNDEFRAVHDYFGHAQAGNNFSRHGENIAFMLHQQMFPPEAFPALTTELRGQTAWLIQNGDFAPQRSGVNWPEAMTGRDYMSAKRPSLDELHQSFNDQLLGAMVMPQGKDARLTVRLFQDANLGTLTHEGAHLLRQLLPEEDVAKLNRVYPGLTDTALTARKRLAEENFVAGLMNYITSRGTLVAARGGLDDPFRKIAASLEQTYGPMLNSAIGPDNAAISRWWDDMFAPPQESPALANPLESPLAKGVETKRYRWESEYEAMQRARQYGEARQMQETIRTKINFNQGMLNTLEKGRQKLIDAMDGVTRSEKAANLLEAGAKRAIGKVETGLANRVPANAAWRPLYDAWKGLQEEAKADETGQIAAMLQDVPDTFAEVIKLAKERGFDPTHIHDVGWDKAQKLLFGHMYLGKQSAEQAIEAGTRSKNLGTLVSHGAADRSIEALASATMEVAHERLTNALVDHIEQVYAKPIGANEQIPPGWVAWDPERIWMLNGTEVSADELKRITGAPQYIIPKEVKGAIREMSKNYDHWAFHVVTRVTAPWRTFVLTLSPRWYINNLFGNTILATVEGVGMRDWISAWRKFRAGEMPNEIVQQSISSFEDSQSSLVRRGATSTLRHEGFKYGYQALHHKVVRLNEAVDEFARTAVMEHSLRSGASREAALMRAYKALVDYGDLGPIERGFVRAVVPFYAWQKGVLKLLIRFPADHPYATRTLQELGKVHMEQLQDQFGGYIPDAYQGLVVGGPKAFNTRAWNPLADSLQLATAGGIAQSINPFVDAILRTILNAPEGGYANQYELSPTGSYQPKVDPLSSIMETIRSLPLVRLGEQATKGEDVYGQSPDIQGALGSFMGAPRSYTDAELQAILDRVTKASQKINPPPKAQPLGRRQHRFRHVATKPRTTTSTTTKPRTAPTTSAPAAGGLAPIGAPAPAATTATKSGSVSSGSYATHKSCRDSRGRFTKCP